MPEKMARNMVCVLPQCSGCSALLEPVRGEVFRRNAETGCPRLYISNDSYRGVFQSGSRKEESEYGLQSVVRGPRRVLRQPKTALLITISDSSQVLAKANVFQEACSVLEPFEGQSQGRRLDRSAGMRRKASSLRGNDLEKKIPNGEESVEMDEGDIMNGREPQIQKPRPVKADNIVRYQSLEKGRQSSQGLGYRVNTTSLIRNPPLINDPSLLTAQSAVDEVLQLLMRVSHSKGIAKVMGRFTSKLTIQDLKLVLTELATGPERNWAKALQVFDWMHDMAVYDIDAPMYHSMLVLVSKLKKMEIAESLLQRMKSDGLKPDNDIYTALASGYVRSGNIRKGITMVEQMKADGLSPTVQAYNVLINGCLKAPKGFETLRALLKKMKEDGLSPDMITYTTMIIVYTRKGHHSEAIRMFQEMNLKDCHPDVLTYNAVLNAYFKRGDIQGMLQAYQSMVEQQVDPDTVTFNILLNALGRSGRTKEVFHLYRLMRKISVTPDVTTCSILVNVYGKAQAWEELDGLIAEMENLGLQPDLPVYNSLISTYGKAGRFEQVGLITKSLQSSAGIMFDKITYNTLIDVYGKAGRLSDVIKWFSEMRKQGVRPDVRTFNALVHAYGRASEYEAVKEVLQLFRANGSKPDLVFYHTLLFMFAKGAKYSDAWGVIGDMKQEGYSLSLDIYNSLVLVFGRSNAQEAVKMYTDMISSNVQPNPTTFKVLIEVHARKGMVDECLKFFRKSRELLGKELNDTVVSSVFGACCNLRRIEEAETILVELEDQYKGLPSVSSLNWLILGYGRQGLWEKAEQTLERMTSKGLVPNEQSYSFLMESYTLSGLLGKAENLRLKMLSCNLVNTISAYNSLLRYHVRSGRMDLALQVLEDLQLDGVKANHNSYAAIISGYGGQDELVNDKIRAHARDLEKLPLDPRHGIYTALLNAVPRCKSNKDAQFFLGILKRLDCPHEVCALFKEVLSNAMQEEAVWMKLASRFRCFDMNGFNLETQRSLQNAIIDALWWFGWETRALRVAKIGLELGTFGQVYEWGKLEWTLNLSGASVGTVQVLLLMWVASVHKLITDGEEVPPRIRIILAEQWQLRLDENKAAIDAVQAHLKDLGAVCFQTEDRMALEMSGSELSSWLKQDHLDKKLFLLDTHLGK